MLLIKASPLLLAKANDFVVCVFLIHIPNNDSESAHTIKLPYTTSFAHIFTYRILHSTTTFCSSIYSYIPYSFDSMQLHFVFVSVVLLKYENYIPSIIYSIHIQAFVNCKFIERMDSYGKCRMNTVKRVQRNMYYIFMNISKTKNEKINNKNQRRQQQQHQEEPTCISCNLRSWINGHCIVLYLYVFHILLHF